MHHRTARRPAVLPLPLLLAFALAGCGREEREGPKMGEAEYEALVLEAVEYMEERQDSLEAEYGLDALVRPAWDQRTATLTLSDSAGTPRVTAGVQFVGSLSKRTKTWLWAWANPTVRAPVKEGARQVRAYGERYGIAKLTEREWPADEADGWEMTAVAARVLNARGGYRTEDADGYTFLVITSLRRAGETGEAADSAPTAAPAPPPASPPGPPPPPPPPPAEPKTETPPPAAPAAGERAGSGFERPRTGTP